MSVPEFLRKSRSMMVYTKARSILNHTRQIVSSEKNIPKRKQRMYADRLDNEATEMYLCMCKANTIHPTTHEDYIARRNYLIEANIPTETGHQVSALALSADGKRENRSAHGQTEHCSRAKKNPKVRSENRTRRYAGTQAD